MGKTLFDKIWDEHVVVQDPQADARSALFLTSATQTVDEELNDSLFAANARGKTDSEAVAVHFATVATARHDLRCDKNWRTDLRHCVVDVGGTSFPKISKLQRPVVRQQHVVGLQISVDDAVFPLTLLLIEKTRFV